ncbi:MAG TPA: hypothetical protein VHQ95_23465, partial [Pyrinomonadaceae bacterium]|nr:hypothetical protein [Pyrinomonadaceae bacterium]
LFTENWLDGFKTDENAAESGAVRLAAQALESMMGLRGVRKIKSKLARQTKSRILQSPNGGVAKW